MADQDLTQKIENGVDGIGAEEARNRNRLAAYGIWEEEGMPDGRAEDHWREAEPRALVVSRQRQQKAAAVASRRSVIVL